MIFFQIDIRDACLVIAAWGVISHKCAHGVHPSQDLPSVSATDAVKVIISVRVEEALDLCLRICIIIKITLMVHMCIRY